MTGAVLLVLALAGADLVGWALTRASARTERLSPSVPIGILIWAVAVAIGSATLLGTAVGTAVLIGAAALAWPVLTSRWVGSALAFVVLVGACAALGEPPAIGGLLAEAGLNPLVTTRVIAIVAVAAFLGLSANILCRGALERARAAEGRGLVSGTGRPVADALPVEPHTLHEALRLRFIAAPLRAGEMRGGRLIGPLERWLIVGLALAGAQGVVAALMAAKGIVRFPEISKNSGEGSKAEEFLIGSLISWGCAGAGTLLIWAVA